MGGEVTPLNKVDPDKETVPPKDTVIGESNTVKTQDGGGSKPLTILSLLRKSSPPKRSSHLSAVCTATHMCLSSQS